MNFVSLALLAITFCHAAEIVQPPVGADELILIESLPTSSLTGNGEDPNMYASFKNHNIDVLKVLSETESSSLTNIQLGAILLFAVELSLFYSSIPNLPNP